MKNLSKEVKIIIAVLGLILIGLIYWVSSKLNDAEIQEKPLKTENVFNIDKGDKVMSFEELLSDDVLGKIPEVKNVFDTEKEDKYADAILNKKKDTISSVEIKAKSNTKVEALENRIKELEAKLARKKPGSQKKYYSKKETPSERKKRQSAWRKRQEEKNDAFFSKMELSSKPENTKDLFTDKQILAQVYLEQTIINKGRIHLRLANDAVIKGIKYPRNTFFYGFTRFAKNRIYIDIKNINNEPVKLFAYDTRDFSKGIHTEVEFNSLATKEVGNDGIDEIETSSIPLGNTIKNLVKKRRNRDEIIFPNNTKIILKIK